MKEYLCSLKTVGLFEGIKLDELNPMLSCIDAEVKNIRRGECILLAGDKPRYIGVVITGQFNIVRDDYWGNRLLVDTAMSGEVFGEALCCADIQESPVTVTASTDSVVMLLSFSRVLNTCPNSCSFHKKLIESMLKLVANKNLQLENRMEIVRLKLVRAKVISYLESFGCKKGDEIEIPFK